MPIVIFFAQRILLFLLALLTFAGLSSEERYFAVEQSFAVEQARKPEVAEILNQENPNIINNTPPTNIELDLDSVQEEEIQLSERPSDFIDSFGKSFNDLKNGIRNKLGGDSDSETTITPTLENPVTPTANPVSKSTTSSQAETIAQPKRAAIGDSPRDAVLNVICLERDGRSLSLTTGSAVIISKSGYVLTNAHVAQFMLNQNQSNIDCELKHSEHSSMNFRATVQYIPDEWKSGSRKKTTTGTGEHDYAILKIVGPGPGGIMLSQFPFISPQTNDKYIEVGNDILLIAYPGKNTGNFDIDGSLPIVSDISFIQDVFTFGTTSADVFSSGVSPVAKQGSSGGAVIDEGKLLGIIVTTNQTPTGTVLNAISLDYIDRSLKEAGLSLSQFK